VRDLRDDKHDAGARFTPSSEWLDAFGAQASAEMLEGVRRWVGFAARWVRWVRWKDKSGALADESYPREVVEFAIGATLAGRLPWSPTARGLEAHLRRAAEARVRDDRDGSHVLRRVLLGRRPEALEVTGDEWANALMVRLRGELAALRLGAVAQRAHDEAGGEISGHTRAALMARVGALVQPQGLDTEVACQLARFADRDLQRLVELLEGNWTPL
jgi:hypothetical protein